MSSRDSVNPSPEVRDARPSPAQRSTTQSRLIVSATIVGIALRLTFALVYWVDKPLTQDEVEYLALARSLAMGHGFRYPPAAQVDSVSEQFGRAPFYPFVLASIGGDAVLAPHPTVAPRSIKIAQSFIGAALIPILAVIAWRAAGPWAGVVTAAIVAVEPSLVSSCSYVLSEALYSVLAWLSVLLFDTAVSLPAPRARGRPIIGAGAIGAVAALTRPAILLFLGLASAWLALKRSRRLALVFLFAAGMVIVPWTIRNIREYGRFMLIAAEGGVTFWTGNHPLARGEGDMAANPDIKRANTEFRREHPGLSSEALEPLYYRAALGYIADHPTWWAGLLVRKAIYLVVPIGPSYRLHSVRYQLASVLPYIVLLPFAIRGAVILRRSRAPAPAMGLLVASTIITCLLFFPQERFRVSEIDPAIAVCAATCLAGKVGHRIRIPGAF